jgi:hypothetical protein
VHGVCGDDIKPVLTYNGTASICGVAHGRYAIRIRKPKPQDLGLVVFSVMHIYGSTDTVGFSVASGVV